MMRKFKTSDEAIFKIHVDPEVKGVIELFDGLLGHYDSGQSIQQYLEQLAERLLAGHARRDSGIKFIVGQKLQEYDLEALFALKFTLDDARFCIAKEHGYKNWQEVALEKNNVDPTFESLVDSMLAGDIDTIKDAVSRDPNIVHQRSSYPHRATLLHYTGSNGVEGYRQVVPLNLAEIVDFLLEAGADQALKANVYGGCTARELTETSKHPYEAGVIKKVQMTYKKYPT